MADATRLAELGMPTELAKEVAAQIAAAQGAAEGKPTNADIEAAIASKTEIAALTSSSDAAAIVAALQA